MSLDKAILHGKEHRKAYCRGNGSYSKSVNPRCRNHGECPWCQGNRHYKNLKREEGAKIDLEEYRKYFLDSFCDNKDDDIVFYDPSALEYDASECIKKITIYDLRKEIKEKEKTDALCISGSSAGSEKGRPVNISAE